MGPEVTFGSWMARNPLGILAAFITLIYAMSALLLGTSISHLTTTNQTLLVIFIVLFPVAVLGSFVWLVSNHHKKLYAPQDYRSDDSFHTADTAQEKIVEKLRGEAPQDPKDVDQEETADGISQSVAQATMQSVMGRIIISETLVFMELQRRYGATVRRNVTIKSGGTMESVPVDGLLESPAGVIVVEIVRATGSRLLSPKLQSAISLLNRVQPIVAGEGATVRALLCIVLDGASKASVEEKIAGVTEPIPPTEFFDMSALFEKYGLPTSQ